MAGNRIHRFGTILTRVEGLIKSGAISEESAPIWMSVYKAFPPHVEPKLLRPIPEQHIRDIVYPEDYIRARFYDTFGSVGVIDNLNRDHKSVSQKFIDRYIETAKTNPDLNDDQLFDRTADILIKEGVRLKSSTVKKSVKTESSYESMRSRKRPSISEIALSDDK